MPQVNAVVVSGSSSAYVIEFSMAPANDQREVSGAPEHWYGRLKYCERGSRGGKASREVLPSCDVLAAHPALTSMLRQPQAKSVKAKIYPNIEPHQKESVVPPAS